MLNSPVFTLHFCDCCEMCPSLSRNVYGYPTPSGLKLDIFRCLKALANIEFPYQGTPQGGVVSPLLENIALNGVESIHSYYPTDIVRGRYIERRDKPPVEPSVRYADDMIIVLRPEDDVNKILEQISKFLEARGMKVSEKKTKVTARQKVLTSSDGTSKSRKTESLEVLPQRTTSKHSVRR
jgi:hypothetical protein